MITIMKHQIIDGLRDSRFLFIAVLVLMAFCINGFIYSENYKLSLEDWQNSIVNTTRVLETKAGNLQEISAYPQYMVKHPSALAFIANEGENRFPNSFTVNAFIYRDPSLSNRGNEMFPIIPSVDWVFIIGTFMSLMAVLLSFASVCGEKRDGTLGLVLSYPVSRLKLFLGKYIGLLFVLIIILVIGVALDLTILVLTGSLPLTEQVAIAIGWVLAISVLFLSFILLSGIMVSSLVQRPAISLVILMIFWLLGIIAVPGVARLLGENSVYVPNSLEVERERTDRWDEIVKSAPERTFSWSSDPAYRFTEDAQNRATYVEAYCVEMQKIGDAAEAKRIQQVEFIQTLSSASPTGLLGVSMQKLCGTGISGYKAFYETCRRYKQQLHSFAVERDRQDPTTPHNVYSWGISIDEGTFSTRPVELSTFPRSHTLWLAGGLYPEQNWPAVQFILFLAANLNMAILAFFALLRYDPR